MPPQWTINASGVSGGSHASKLVGCHFKINTAGNAYELTEPNPHNVLYTVGPPLPGTGTMEFGPFNYDGVKDWTVIATAPLTPGVNFSGGWSTGAQLQGIDPIPPTGPQSGTYTAQSDGTFEDPENVAASAKA